MAHSPKVGDFRDTHRDIPRGQRLRERASEPDSDLVANGPSLGRPHPHAHTFANSFARHTGSHTRAFANSFANSFARHTGSHTRAFANSFARHTGSHTRAFQRPNQDHLPYL
jgi:hypothetical protein